MNTRSKRNIPWFWIFIFLGMFSDELFGLIIPLGIGLLVYYAIKSSREKNAAQNQAHTRAQQEFVRSSTTQSYKSSTQTAAKTSSSSAKTNQTGSYNAQAQKTSSTTSSKKTSSSDTLTLTATEKKLVQLYRKADSSTKKAAMNLLKGENNALELIGSMLTSNKDVSDMASGLFGSLLSGKREIPGNQEIPEEQ